MNSLGKLNAAIYRNLQVLMNDRMRDLDIGSGQYDFFYVISQQEGLSLKELGEELHVGKSTTTKAVQDLVKKGYVRKVRDTEDARIDHLFLTVKGKGAVPLMQQISDENDALGSSMLSEKEAVVLNVLLNRVLEGLQEEKALRQAEAKRRRQGGSSK
ncbi:MAG: MarR family winged helix-turn-helix transcriptional regulator [Oscillospiraceae bacterium]